MGPYNGGEIRAGYKDQGTQASEPFNETHAEDGKTDNLRTSNV
jgi:hypothetical protein